MWTQTPEKKIPKIFRFFREVTPDSPSPRKPHINTGSRSENPSKNQMPVWGVFGVKRLADFARNSASLGIGPTHKKTREKHTGEAGGYQV